MDIRKKKRGQSVNIFKSVSYKGKQEKRKKPADACITWKFYSRHNCLKGRGKGLYTQSTSSTVTNETLNTRRTTLTTIAAKQRKMYKLFILIDSRLFSNHRAKINRGICTIFNTIVGSSSSSRVCVYRHIYTQITHKKRKAKK